MADATIQPEPSCVVPLSLQPSRDAPQQCCPNCKSLLYPRVLQQLSTNTPLPEAYVSPEQQAGNACVTQKFPDHYGLLESEVEAKEELGEALVERSQPYKEIKNLRWIRKNTVYNEALEEWERKTKVLGDRVDRWEHRSADVISQVYNLVGFFSAFQGLVLTAVAQLSSSSKNNLCGLFWSPCVLSGFAAIVTIFGIWQKLNRLKAFEETSISEKEGQRIVADWAANLRRKGSNFKFREIALKTKRPRPYFWLDKVPVFLALLVFTAVLIFSYYSILCSKWLIPDWH